MWSQDTAAPSCGQLPANLLLSIVSHQTKTMHTRTHTPATVVKIYANLLGYLEFALLFYCSFLLISVRPGLCNSIVTCCDIWTV